MEDIVISQICEPMKMPREPKDDKLTIRIRRSIKQKAVKRAEEEDRSIANYIERLIEEDWAKKQEAEVENVIQSATQSGLELSES